MDNITPCDQCGSLSEIQEGTFSFAYCSECYFDVSSMFKYEPEESKARFHDRLNRAAAQKLRAKSDFISSHFSIVKVGF